MSRNDNNKWRFVLPNDKTKQQTNWLEAKGTYIDLYTVSSHIHIKATIMDKNSWDISMTSLFFQWRHLPQIVFVTALIERAPPYYLTPPPAQKQSWHTVTLRLNDKEATSQASDLFKNLYLKHYQHRGSTNLTK